MVSFSEKVLNVALFMLDMDHSISLLHTIF